MLLSQTEGIIIIILSSLPASINVSCEAFGVCVWVFFWGGGGGGGGGEEGSSVLCMGVGCTVELSFITLAQCFSLLAHPWYESCIQG